MTTDAIRPAFDEHRQLTVSEAIEAHLNTYTSRSNAVAYCWGFVVSSAERCDWETVRLVVAAYKRCWPAERAS